MLILKKIKQDLKKESKEPTATLKKIGSGLDSDCESEQEDLDD